ncbi:MAG TPA: acyloxyacyl hydrolase, partial [bacterium]|nr:acyloxyacyl hydrolase [bacterium]
YSGVRYSRTTYWNIVTRAGAALRFDDFLLQGAYEHRSNAGLGPYNRGVDLITAAVGVRF